MNKFLIIGNMNAIANKEIFPYIKNNELWLGVSKRSLDFILQNGELINVNAVWFTNLDHNKRNTPIDLYKHYNAEEYPKYGNYDAIEVGKVCEIPMDYDGIMGVPITFLDKYCPQQFEIVGCPNAKLLPQGWKGMTKEFIELFNSYTKPSNIGKLKEGWWFPYYITDDGKPMIPYSRILIRRKL